MSNRGHPTKFFLLVFDNVSGDFPLNWPIKMRDLGEAELSSAILAFLLQSLDFDWLNVKRSHENVVDKI